MPAKKLPATPVASPTSIAKSKVLLVDDHPITRQGIKELLDQQPGLVVCAETDNAAEASGLVSKYSPDLAIVDISLKTTNGIELTKNLMAQAPKLPVLIVSMLDETLYAERALRAGAKGYLMKEEAGEKLVAAIGRVLQGEIYVSERVSELMLSRYAGKQRPADRFGVDQLTDREMEVFQLLGNGFSTQQIAQKLGLSAKTIDSYREQLKTKLKLKTGSDLLRHAINWVRESGV